MSGLEHMGIRVEGPEPMSSTGNTLPLLHEIRHALDRLLSTGESTVIDLSGIPMGPQDEEQLFASLGTGEVEARLETLGSSIIRETGISGVWVVAHSNVEGEAIGKFIEVAFVPAILEAQPEDVKEALTRLSSQDPMGRTE